jgi:hypothetical protein
MKSMEQADQWRITKAEEPYGVWLGLILTAPPVDPLYTPLRRNPASMDFAGHMGRWPGRIYGAWTVPRAHVGQIGKQ